MKPDGYKAWPIIPEYNRKQIFFMRQNVPYTNISQKRILRNIKEEPQKFQEKLLRRNGNLQKLQQGNPKVLNWKEFEVE